MSNLLYHRCDPQLPRDIGLGDTRGEAIATLQDTAEARGVHLLFLFVLSVEASSGWGGIR